MASVPGADVEERPASGETAAYLVDGGATPGGLEQGAAGLEGRGRSEVSLNTSGHSAGEGSPV